MKTHLCEQNLDDVNNVRTYYTRSRKRSYWEQKEHEDKFGRLKYELEVMYFHCILLLHAMLG